MAGPEEKTILVVDDEEDVAFYLKTLLEDAGFKVVTAGDGEEALEKVRRFRPDLVSLDLVMPRKSGIKFYYELRRAKEWSRLPVIVVTGHARDEAVKRDMSETFAGKTISGPGIYLEKPVNPADYVNVVKRELGIEVGEAPAAASSGEARDLMEEARDLVARSDPETLKEVIRLMKKK